MHFLGACVHNEYVRNIHPKTLVLIGILVTLAVVLLGIAIKISGTSEKFMPGAQITPVPTIEKTASITFSPSTLNLAASTSGSVEVMVTTGKNPITGAQAQITYDPTVITNVKLTAPNGANSLMGAVGTYTNLFTDNKPGTLTFAVAINPSSPEVSGTGSIGTITFTVLKTKPETQLTFGSSTAVTSTASMNSILNTTTPLVIQLQ